MQSSDIISSCEMYRYELSRVLDRTKPAVISVGLNPSRADAYGEDPTSRACINYAKAWGFGALLVGNLFAYRSTDPRALRGIGDPIGPDNDDHLESLQVNAALVVCAWGNGGALKSRDRQVLAMLQRPHCLSKLKSGSPGHPLYKSPLLQPIPL